MYQLKSQHFKRFKTTVFKGYTGMAEITSEVGIIGLWVMVQSLRRAHHAAATVILAFFLWVMAVMLLDLPWRKVSLKGLGCLPLLLQHAHSPPEVELLIPPLLPLPGDKQQWLLYATNHCLLTGWGRGDDFLSYQLMQSPLIHLVQFCPLWLAAASQGFRQGKTWIQTPETF